MGKYSLKNVKKKVKEKVDNWNDNDTGKTRIKWYNRWAKISGADQLPDGSYNWEQIDWENEFVRIEWYLCDPQILMKIGDPKYYAEGLSRIPEELHETL